MILQRIKNLWKLSAYAPEYKSDGFATYNTPVLKENLPPKKQVPATFIPRVKQTPLEKLTEAQS